MRRVIGIHSCEETLKVRPRSVSKVYLRQNWKNSEALLKIKNQADGRNIRVDFVGEGYLKEWGVGHQGVGLEVSESPSLDWDSLGGETPRIILALDGIEDPQNLGAIMRSAWLMGADGVVIPQDRAAKMSAVVSKAASGGAEHIPLERVPNLSESLRLLKEMGFWAYGLSQEGKQSLWEIEFPAKTVLVLGAEGKGMRPKTQKNCDDLVRIPQKSPSASYNASVSMGILLAEVRRQWRIQGISVD